MIKPIILETKDQSRIWSNKGRRIHFDQANFNDIDDEIRYDIILIDTEAEIVEGDLMYSILLKRIDTYGRVPRFMSNWYKVISSTNKSHNLPQLSPQSIQLLINYYNEHKCMPESVDVKDDLTLNKGDLAINPFTGKADNILGILKDKDCVFFENSDTPYSIKSVKLAQPNVKLNQQGEVYIIIPEVSIIDKLYNVIEAELELFNAMNSLSKMSMMEVLNQLNSKKK